MSKEKEYTVNISVTVVVNAIDENMAIDRAVDLITFNVRGTEGIRKEIRETADFTVKEMTENEFGEELCYTVKNHGQFLEDLITEEDAQIRLKESIARNNSTKQEELKFAKASKIVELAYQYNKK